MGASAFDPINWAKSVPPIVAGNGRTDRTAHHVLLVLATFAKKDGSGAWPSVGKLAVESYVIEEVAARALDALQDAGLIRQTGDRNGTPVWQLNLELDGRGANEARAAERRERERALAAERQRRKRQRAAGNGDGERDVTGSNSVTVTGSNPVTNGGVTGSKGVSHGTEGRDVTGPSPLQPQVSGGVTALNELPLNCQSDGASQPSIDAPSEESAEGGVLLHLPKPAKTPTKAKKANGYTPEFEAFWNNYPKRNGARVGKFPASQEWVKALKLTTAETLMSSVRSYASQCGDFPKDAERWLKNRMWEDFAPAAGNTSQELTFDSLRAKADAATVSRLIRVPWADPFQHPDDTSPRPAWLRARRLEFIDRHRDAIVAALTKAS